MKQIITLLILFLLCAPGFAQRETDNWYFGDLASLEFNKIGLPASFANSAMSTPEGCASISDEFGNLLFYTNGETVWNALQLPMANGTGLFGHAATSQSALIVPKPGNKSGFYIFTIEAISASNTGLRFSEVDMAAFNGLGEVKSSFKNTLPTGNVPVNARVSEKITAVYASDHRDIWVIAHYYIGNNSEQFVAFKVSATGVGQNPVVSNFQITGSTVKQGYLKASPDGKYLAAAYQDKGVNLYNFNNKTGIVTNPVMLEPIGQPIYYGVEFSPDGSKLYTANKTNGEVRQFNLTNPAPSAILASRTLIGTSTGPISNGALQLASNGKIYLARQGASSLMEIANPNAPGLACNFRQGPTLAPLTFSNYGLPNFMQSYFEAPRFTFTGACQANPFVFTITNLSGIDSVHWDFGDPLSGVTNTSGSKQPTHIFRMSGFFKVSLTVYIGGEASYFSRQVDVKNSPEVFIGRDTVLCNGSTLTLKNSFPRSAFNETYLWSTGESGLMIKVSSAGTYWLELNNGTCTTRDSIKVSYVNGPAVKLGADTTVCGNNPVTIKPQSIDPGAKYFWQPGGETTPSIQVTKTGMYQVTVTKNGCSAIDIRNVKFIPGMGFELGPDRELCEGEEVILKGPLPVPAPVYLWSDTSAGTTLKVKKSGKYWLRITRNNCSVSDTVTIKFKPCPPPIMPVVPNIITPNADGKNDKLIIGNLPEGIFWSLKLYNRWGQLILDDPQYQHNWPQKYLPDSHYYYLLVEPSSGRTWKGWLEVVH